VCIIPRLIGWLHGANELGGLTGAEFAGRGIVQKP
jgi:hypothetical protein